MGIFVYGWSSVMVTLLLVGAALLGIYAHPIAFVFALPCVPLAAVCWRAFYDEVKHA